MGKQGVFLFLVIGVVFLAVIASSKEADVLEGIGMGDSFRTYSETVCEDNFDNKSCYDNMVIECNGLQYEVPSTLTGYVIHDKVYVEEECDSQILDKGGEKDSPFDRIKDEQIKLYSNKVVIEVKNAQKRWIVDSNSMDPLIDEFSNTIEVKPKKASDVHVGDIAAYKSPGSDIVWVHRVIEIGEDKEGEYFILKGDNNLVDDGKVRFEQIDGIVVGIVY